MKAELILIVFGLYTALLFLVSWLTGRKADEDSFYIGNRSSKWYVVAYGMIGASLSGVTFISVPGDVGSMSFSYMVMVLGYLVGYAVIAQVLLPMYYRLNLTSIYTYLGERFGVASYKTGASFFLLSRFIGAAFRMFLVVNVLQVFVLNQWNVPFWITVVGFMILIMLYTMRGGIKTIVWTDTLQTTFMLLALVITLILIGRQWEGGFSGLLSSVSESTFSKMFFWTEWKDARFVPKMFFSGMFITIVMTGLDQDMMQKNLSCKSYKEARKNMYWMSFSLVPVNFLFLLLGVALFLFAAQNGIVLPEQSDDLFPMIAFNYLGIGAGLVFIIGLIAAAYSSADSAMTSLTTSFSLDILNLQGNKKLEETKKSQIRKIVHLGVAFVLMCIILVFHAIKDESVIKMLFTVAGYTYGPLLGLYAFGLFTKLKASDMSVPFIAVASPALAYLLKLGMEKWINGYQVGFELLIYNGLIMFVLLFVSSIIKRSMDSKA